MPEGVEILLSKEMIKPLVLDRIITGIEFPQTSRYNNSYPEGFKKFDTHFSSQDKNYSAKIKDVRCKGKFMYWTLTDDWHILFTYGMTGQFSPIAGKHVCMKVCLDDPLRVYFNDPRHFGTIRFVDSYAKMNLKLSSLGWDPLQDLIGSWSPYLNRMIKKSSKPIGQLLMDQSLFAGLATIYERRRYIKLRCRLGDWATN